MSTIGRCSGGRTCTGTYYLDRNLMKRELFDFIQLHGFPELERKRLNAREGGDAANVE